jgi:hypothetical protein
MMVVGEGRRQQLYRELPEVDKATWDVPHRFELRGHLGGGGLPGIGVQAILPVWDQVRGSDARLRMV